MNPVEKAVEIPRRALGRTGAQVTIVGLGGEGVLRTYDRLNEARAVIQRALELGVNYFDCARAYAGSEEYYGASLIGKRKEIFLTSKAFERSRKAAMAQLEQTLRTMKTDYLDLWQMHDVREFQELDMVCGGQGALEAFRQAREEGKARFLGVTGHYDPAVLTKAIEVFDFDTVLLPVNPTEAHYNSFLNSTLTVAQERGMGVIGMKVPSRGHLVGKGGVFSIGPLIRYALSHATSTIIIGCDNPQQVEENVRAACAFTPMSEMEMRDMERAYEPYVPAGQFYKKGMY